MADIKETMFSIQTYAENNDIALEKIDYILGEIINKLSEDGLDYDGIDRVAREIYNRERNALSILANILLDYVIESAKTNKSIIDIVNMARKENKES